MTAPKREQFKNTAQTTLDEVGGINNSVTSFDVDDGSVFPAVGNFRILIESEIMLVTARSSDTLTVVRGQEGTAAASHADDLNVTHILTAAALERMGKDNSPVWGEATFPPLNKLVAADGVTPLTSADFTWTNQGSSTVNDLAGTMMLRVPATAAISLSCLTVPAPSAPWTMVVALQMFAMVDNAGACNPIIGALLRESGTGKIITFGMNRNSTTSQRFGIDRWTNATTYAGATPWVITNPIFHSDVLWFKINDNNTNLIYSISPDGINWIEVLSESRTVFMAGAPNQIGFQANNGGNSSAKDALIKLLHFHTE